MVRKNNSLSKKNGLYSNYLFPQFVSHSVESHINSDFDTNYVQYILTYSYKANEYNEYRTAGTTYSWNIKCHGHAGEPRLPD